mmetsp:Transcript_34909/g.97990  ORF Transcript_34909/g.97990 Transcript_34909/m.97990 type:complete len:230 (-) Transcript_34909:87-776(-)
MPVAAAVPAYAARAAEGAAVGDEEEDDEGSHDEHLPGVRAQPPVPERLQPPLQGCFQGDLDGEADAGRVRGEPQPPHGPHTQHGVLHQPGRLGARAHHADVLRDPGHRLQRRHRGGHAVVPPDLRPQPRRQGLDGAVQRRLRGVLRRALLEDRQGAQVHRPRDGGCGAHCGPHRPASPLQAGRPLDGQAQGPDHRGRRGLRPLRGPARQALRGGRGDRHVQPDALQTPV